MYELWSGIASEVADTGCRRIHGVRDLSGTHSAGLQRHRAEVPVLAIQTIEGAALVEDGEVLVPFLGSPPVSKRRIPCARPARAHPVGDAVRRQGVVIPGHVPRPDYTQQAVALPLCQR